MAGLIERIGSADALVLGAPVNFGNVNALTQRFLVQVCTNISCNLCGAEDVLKMFLSFTDTELGETSEDGDFTVIEAECLAACGYPTCVQINSRYYESVTPADVQRIIEHLRAEGE
jgi:NADH:ubiquinone oxidoreductase subunit E